MPLAQACLPARLGGLQADAPASAVQRAEGGRPARIVARVLETAPSVFRVPGDCSRLSMSLQGAKRLLMCR